MVIIITNKKIAQYCNLRLEILERRFSFLYEIKCKTKKIQIKITSNLNSSIISEVFSIAKSKMMYFSIEYIRSLKSLTLNAIHVRNTKYWVIRIERITPILVLKNLLFLRKGNLSKINLCKALNYQYS